MFDNLSFMIFLENIFYLSIQYIELKNIHKAAFLSHHRQVKVPFMLKIREVENPKSFAFSWENITFFKLCSTKKNRKNILKQSKFVKKKLYFVTSNKFTYE